MRDEELRSKTDYNAGQKEAAKRVLIEVTNLFTQYEDEMIVIGGWTPELLFPEGDHIGSVDVDFLCNQLEMEDPGYLNIKRILEKNGYTEHPDNFFSFQKIIIVDEMPYTVDLDLLTGMHGSTPKRRSQKFQGISALKLRGGDFAFECPPVKIKIDGTRPNGALDTATVRVVSLMPFLVLKADALSRYKPKDAYDIYFCLKNTNLQMLVEEFIAVKDLEIIISTIEKLKEKFKSTKHTGPKDVVDFMEIVDEEEREFILRDVYERVNYLVEALEKAWTE
jgi:hypothetical protein